MNAKEQVTSSSGPSFAGPLFPRMLVGIDGSRGSQQAARWGMEIARLGRTRATVLHVSPPVGALPSATRGGEGAIALQRALESAVDDLRDAGVSTERLATQGEPRVEVVRAALLGRADLICLGARGKTATRRISLGGVAEAAKDRAAASLLLARGPPPAKRILAAKDASADSDRALAVATALAERWRVPLDVLHVVEGDIADAQLPLAADDADIAPLIRSSAEIHSLLASGDPAEQIIAKAKERGANLIVIGCRGAGGGTKTTPGQVAERVLRASQASVLMTRAPTG